MVLGQRGISDHLVLKGQQDQLEQPDQLEIMEHLEHRDLQDHLEMLVNLDQLVNQGTLDPPVLLVDQGLLGQLALQDPQVHQDSKEHKVLQEAMGHKDHLELLDLLVSREMLVHLDSLGHQASKELQDLPDPLGQMDNQDYLDHQGLMAIKVQQDLQGSREIKEHQEIKVLLEHLVLLERLDRMGRLDWQETQVRLVIMDWLEVQEMQGLMVLQVSRACQDNKGHQAQLAQQDLQVSPDCKGHRVMLVFLVWLVVTVALVHQEAKANLVHQDRLAQQETQDHQGHLARLGA